MLPSTKMTGSISDSDCELPNLRTIILPRPKAMIPEQRLRRSPRRNDAVIDTTSFRQQHRSGLENLMLSSHQRIGTAASASPSKRSPRKTLQRPSVAKLPNFTHLSKPISKPAPKSKHIRIQEDDTRSTAITTRSSFKAGRTTRLPNRFIPGEARCNDDLADSDADNDGEEEDTDLSGFIVDDAAELSYHESMESGSEDEREMRRRRTRMQAKSTQRRRLVRGRRKQEDTEDEDVLPESTAQKEHEDLAECFQSMSIDATKLVDRRHRDIQVIDLVSPDAKPIAFALPKDQSKKRENDDLIKKLNGLKLSPPCRPADEQFTLRSVSSTLEGEADAEVTESLPNRKLFITPPATPPRSPSKLRSPTKLRSPSKQLEDLKRPSQRPSMDDFWDHNVVNELNEQHSPRKAPVTSPRKKLEQFHLWSDSEVDGDTSKSGMSSESVPSPCESPSKTRGRTSPSKSPEKLEKQWLLTAKRADQQRKKDFEANRSRMALDLLSALDKHITNSQLSTMTRSTGGIQITWSKTLRSTAGRAQWRRTVTKPTGSPIKSSTTSSSQDEIRRGNTVAHFARIELATKIIDRPDRLVSTLTHEFCHLANYMVSGIRNQPHGPSFHDWGRKCIKWLREESGRSEWANAEVATKHNYEIEFKYLWVCVGRPAPPPSLSTLPSPSRPFSSHGAMTPDDEGCGVEYGRHSKSVDPDRHRCGKCKGLLVQVRPKPRAASPVKKAARATSPAKKVTQVEVVELSD